MMEHHGTSLVSFFYDVAKQSQDDESHESLKEDFRYPGPKPSTKESGILMLADATEAAIRPSISRHYLKLKIWLKKSLF